MCIMSTISGWNTAYIRATDFVRSGAIQHSGLFFMRLLQLGWLLSVVCLLIDVVIQILCGAFGYSPKYDTPLCSDLETVAMSALLFIYTPFFLLRAIIIKFASEYMPISDYLDHLKAKRMLCIIMACCSGNKPVNQAALAIYAIGTECEIEKVQRYIISNKSC